MNLVNKLLRVPEKYDSTDNKEIYKPMGLNFYSSFLFLLPIYYSYINKQKRISSGIFIVFILSILNHGTYNKTLNILDKFVAVITIVYFTLEYFSLNIYYILGLFIFIIVTIEFLYFKCSYHPTHAIKYHSIIHIMVTMASLLLIESKKNRMKI